MYIRCALIICVLKMLHELKYVNYNCVWVKKIQEIEDPN